MSGVTHFVLKHKRAVVISWVLFTGDRAFVSRDGRTVYGLIYPGPGKDSPFGQLDALSTQSGGDDGRGVLLEAILGGLGAFVVLAFVLLDATIIRALIVPATISLLGRWNWWLAEG
jgi:hypothetical protein